ncbi:single-stranded DNA-binding protein [Sphingomonas phage Lucius]|uniref:Single-stranded DNA-binding protein n=1 Tax=Sphingomonas phage Lucius TaxID=2686313 RepID=A0A6M3T9U5_9CAUD|nr:single-stranded DNA-binding protein [Sphingomonas phage Lucius]QJD54469.1 single-stranded DNA-binding protein [Sphingomonas phage Lucius]
MISDEDRHTLNAFTDIANLWAYRASVLIAAVERCYELKSAKGIEEMAAFAFNTQGITPKFGGGGGLPVGKHPVVIYNTKLEATNSGTGGKMVLQLEVIDGPAKGAKGDENLILQHSNPTVVRISSEQLTAICHVVDLPNGFQDTQELHGKPFVVEVAPQKDKPEYTEVIAVFDMNGNEPGQQGGGNNAGSGSFGGGNAGGGFGGGQQGGGQPQSGGWGNGGNAGGQQGGQGQQGNDGGQNGGQGGNNGGNAGWGGNGGGAANQGGNGGGWQQNGGGNNGGQGGGWGAR